MTFLQNIITKMEKEKLLDISSKEEQEKLVKLDGRKVKKDLSDCLSSDEEAGKLRSESTGTVIKGFIDMIVKTLKFPVKVLKKLCEKFGDVTLKHYVFKLGLTMEDLEKMTDEELDHIAEKIQQLQVVEEREHKYGMRYPR